MKKIGLAIALVVLFILLVGITMWEKESASSPMPENEIIIIKEYVNWAWGFQNHGFFVNTAGEVYQFDFGTGDYRGEKLEGDALLAELEKISRSAKPIKVLERETVQKIYDYGMKINPNATYKEEFQAYDAGQNTIIFRDPVANRWIECYSEGDYLRELKNLNAKRVASLVKNLNVTY